MRHPITVKNCHILIICALLSACSGSLFTNSESESGSGTARPSRENGEQHHEAEKHWQPPEVLAGLPYHGEISSTTTRTFRYRSENRKHTLQIMLYPLPQDWQSMSPQRAVAGHYGELRQRRVKKALSDNANVLTLVSEQMVDLEGYPTAQAQMRWLERDRPMQSRALLVTLEGRQFIRISNASYQHKPLALLQQSKRALAEFRAARTAGH